MKPRITLDSQTGFAYINLAQRQDGDVETSLRLHPRDGEPAILDHLILDLDKHNRLLGIEVLGPARKVLRQELLKDADRG